MKKLSSMLITMTLCTVALTGCSSTSTEETSSTASATTTESTELSNPWTESDKDGVTEATGFEMTAPEEATEVSYSYMSEGSLAQMTYVLDDAEWTYRIQMADELTDISGIYLTWDTETEGEVSGFTAKYYSYASDTDSVKLVNWYDAVTGVTYSLSVTGTNIDELDMQTSAEAIYQSLQGESIEDAKADADEEAESYFLGEYTRSEDGSTLTITKNEDDTFTVSMNITRLCNLEGGIGTFTNHKISFEIDDPSEGKLSGEIYRDEDNNLTVKITDSEWSLLPTDEVLEGFEK